MLTSYILLSVIWPSLFLLLNHCLLGSKKSLESEDSGESGDGNGKEKELSALPEGCGDGNWKKNKLSALPEDFGQRAKANSRVDISENEIAILNFDFAILSATLKELDVSSNKLKFLPPSIASLRNLEIMHAYQNELVSIPEDIGNLAALRELNVFNNKITGVPESISKLGSLELLNISANQVLALRPKHRAAKRRRREGRPRHSRAPPRAPRAWQHQLHSPSPPPDSRCFPAARPTARQAAAPVAERPHEPHTPRPLLEQGVFARVARVTQGSKAARGVECAAWRASPSSAAAPPPVAPPYCLRARSRLEGQHVRRCAHNCM